METFPGSEGKEQNQAAVRLLREKASREDQLFSSALHAAVGRALGAKSDRDKN